MVIFDPLQKESEQFSQMVRKSVDVTLGRREGCWEGGGGEGIESQTNLVQYIRVWLAGLRYHSPAAPNKYLKFVLILKMLASKTNHQSKPIAHKIN